MMKAVSSDRGQLIKQSVSDEIADQGEDVHLWIMSTASWPGLSRPSTSSFLAGPKDVDARDKPGHDGEFCVPRMLRSAPYFTAWCAAKPGS
jgi:hypothetical protein